LTHVDSPIAARTVGFGDFVGFGRFVGGPFAGTAGPGGAQNSQLTQDIRQLRSDVQAIRRESFVTVGALTALRSDFQALAEVGLRPDRRLLQAFENDLLTAVAAANTGGTTLTPAQLGALRTQFTHVFGPSASGSSNPALITRAFNDEVNIVEASNVTTADLGAIAAGQAKIRAGLGSLSSTGPGCTGWGGIGIADAPAASLLIPGF
jgi:hypothetical protein